jgi:hypothetical protein
MITVDLQLLAAVVGGVDPGEGEQEPGPNRRSTEGQFRLQTPLYDTGWDTGTTTTAKTGYAACLELMPDNLTPAQIREACGTPNRPRF